MKGLILPAIASLTLLLSLPAQAGVPNDGAEAYALELPHLPNLQRTLDLAPARDVTTGLTARYGGGWRVGEWNPFSGTPESIYGSGIEVGALGNDEDAVTLLRALVDDNADLLGIGSSVLAVDRVVRGLGKVAVHFSQLLHGVPVDGGRVRILATESGRVYFLGVTVYDDIDVSPVPFVGERQAISIATTSLPFDQRTDSIDGLPELMVLPIRLPEAGADYHLVWRIRVRIRQPFGVWITYVDAHDGRIVGRVSDVHHAYSGTSEADVDDRSYCDGSFDHPLREMSITVSGFPTVVTDENGQFMVVGDNGTQTLSAAFDGPQANIERQDGPDATLFSPIQPDVPLTISWNDTNAHRGERDAFYWVNESDAFVKSIDPTYDHSKYTVNVNVNQCCNGNWSGNVINLFRECGGCANIATMGDFVAHEFGHGVQADLLGSQGPEGLGEGNADVLGNFISDDSVIFRGFYLNNCATGIRNCENTLVYPDDLDGGNHHDGQIICGFHWDARQELEADLGAAAGEELSATLWHYARKLLLPFSQPDQVLATYAVDDDDGDLTNGTPHFDALTVGCENHYEPPSNPNFCPEILAGVFITHTPLGSTTNHDDPYTVEAEVFSTVAAIQEASLFYRVDAGAFIELPMANTVGDLYAADIPAQPADAAIDYYIFARDAVANTKTHPETAPDVTHRFLVASILDELEAAGDWTVGAPDDDASSGIWVRGDPIGTEAQPEDDHTPDPGTLCFMTGQCDGPICQFGCTVGCNDVDGGKTTLFSPIWDLSAATQSARLFYWRWYSNNVSGNGEDVWVVDVSNDGGDSWTSVENLSPPDEEQNRWVLVEIDLTDLFGTPDQVQLRFVASDEGPLSQVEAAVDDVSVLIESGTMSVAPTESPRGPTRLALRAVRPNPFNPRTRVAYDTPVAEHVLVAVYDASGRRVRTLADSWHEGGSHTLEWDGRDDAGHELASGVYHLRVSAAGSEAVRKVTLLK